MIVNRCLTFSRINPFGKESFLLNKKGNYLKELFIRNSHHEYYYRKLPPVETSASKTVIIVSSIAWWWFLWHCLTDLKKISGITYPDPAKWTDEELGIPED